MNTPDRRRLLHVLDAIERIELYCVDGKESLGDAKTRDAVLRCVTIVGEALGALTADTYQRLPSLPPHLPRGQRNLLVHEYWRVDMDIIWDTITRDFPELTRDITALVHEDPD